MSNTSKEAGLHWIYDLSDYYTKTRNIGINYHFFVKCRKAILPEIFTIFWLISLQMLLPDKSLLQRITHCRKLLPIFRANGNVRMIGRQQIQERYNTKSWIGERSQKSNGFICIFYNAHMYMKTTTTQLYTSYVSEFCLWFHLKIDSSLLRNKTRLQQHFAEQKIFAF